MYNFRVLFNRFSVNSLLAIIVVAIVLLPLIVIFVKSTSLTTENWEFLWKNNILELLWRTVKLAAVVAVLTIIMGVSTAWLLTRRRFRGSSIFVWLMIIPLAIPTYVYANIFNHMLSESGWLSWIADFWVWVAVDSVALSGFADLLSVAFILSFASYSYVFLLVRSSLRKSTRSLEEAARIQGARSHEVFWRVNVPLLRPAIAASMAIVVLHTISDFGAVKILGYRTFTSAIYFEYDRNPYDLGRPAALSMVVVVLAMTFLIVERYFRNRQKFYSNDEDIEQSQIRPVSGWHKMLVWLWVGLIALFAVILPVAWILVYSIDSVAQNQVGSSLWINAFSSFLVASATATVALFAAFPVAYYYSRRKTVLSAICMHASNVGFILPGPVLALGILIIGATLFNGVSSYAYVALWIGAVSIRYLPLAVQAQEALLQQLTPSMEQAGRVLGMSSWQNLKRVIMPAIKPGMISAWVLVFIDALKELPAALLLRQLDVTTLPVMIFFQAIEDESIELAAPASLMLIVATLPAIWFMMRGQRLRNST